MARDHLGAMVPFLWKESEFARGRRPVRGWKDVLVRWVVGWVQVWVGLLDRILERIWGLIGVGWKGVEVLEESVLGEIKPKKILERVGLIDEGEREKERDMRNGVLVGKGSRKKIE